MNNLILHHYDLSPYAQKVRAIFAYKGISWGSCETSIVPPRPALALLAGGHRRIPVLQIGSDVFCDSNLMVPVLERLYPDRPISLGEDVLAVPASQWLEPRMFTLFSALKFLDPADFMANFQSIEALQFFAQDRARFMAPMMDTSKNADSVLACVQNVGVYARWIEARLQRAPFLQGDAPTHADFSAWHPFNWIKDQTAHRRWFGDFSRLWDWVERIASFKGGERSAVTAEAALAVARATEPAFDWNNDPQPGDPDAGTTVAVSPLDYGIVPVRGSLSSIGPDHVAIERHTPETGALILHFPRWGYKVEPA